jgi:hypothetical protein
MSKGCGDIDFRIRMVHSVKAPQDIDSVQQPVLGIGQCIQNEYRDNEPYRARQPERVEQTVLL